MNYKDKKKLIKIFENSSKKGLLVWYGDDGSVGKTFMSILISQNMIFKNKSKMVYFLSYSEERLRWIEKYCLKLNMGEHITPINYCNRDMKADYDFKDCLVVIDDAKHFISNVTKSKKIFRYWVHLKNTNCKILAMCDKEGFEKLDDWVILQKLLDPGSIPDINTGNKIDLQLIKKFKYERGDTPGIQIEVPNDILYYGKLNKAAEGGYEGSGNIFIIKCEMSLFQFQNYYNVYKKEMQLIEKYKAIVNPPQKFILARKHIESRKISNVFYLPNDFIRADIMAEEYETKTLLDENENEYQVRVKGWVRKNELNIGIMSCKMVEFFINISKNYRGINVVYSTCVKKHGLTLINTLCTIYKINCINLVYADEGEIEEQMNNLHRSDAPVLVLLDPNTVDLLINENQRFKNKLCIHIFETELKNNFYKKLLNVCGNYANNIVYRYQSVAPAEPIGTLERNKSSASKYGAEPSPRETSFSSFSGDHFSGARGYPNENTKDEGKGVKCVDEFLYERNSKRAEIEDRFLNFLKKKTIF